MCAAGVYVPYRDSKLTRILQPSLEGSALVALLTTISPLADSAAESESTLAFAAEAKRVTTHAQVNTRVVAPSNSGADAEQIRRLNDEKRVLAAQVGLCSSSSGS